MSELTLESWDTMLETFTAKVGINGTQVSVDVVVVRDPATSTIAKSPSVLL